VRVCLLYEDQDWPMDVMYAIDMENDVIRDITFTAQNEVKGLLSFSYLQDIDDIGDEFTEPAISSGPEAPSRQSLGVLWLVHLVQGPQLNGCN
jgi:hypothetical protein